MQDVFWNQWIWRYYWGPVVADARETTFESNTIHQGYTLFSELTYGIVLAISAYGIYRLFQRVNADLDHRFVLALIPFLLLGGTVRALEDAMLFKEPLVFFFIAPVIYFVIGVAILCFYLLGLWLERHAGKHEALLLVSGLFIVQTGIYLGLYLTHGGSHYVLPPIQYAMLVVATLCGLFATTMKNGRMEANHLVFFVGLHFLAISVMYILTWPTDADWLNAYNTNLGLVGVAGTGVGTGIGTGVVSAVGAGLPIVRHDVMLMVLGYSLGMTLLIYVIFSVLSRKKQLLSVITLPMSLAIIFGQMVDGIATYIGVDLFGYAEKHPLPDLLFTAFGTSLVFIPLKAGLGIFLAYIVEVSLKEELEPRPILKTLLQVILITLGLSPGIRDMMRLVMGV